MTRRQFASIACAASSMAVFRDPLQMLLRSLVDGIINKAQADDTLAALPNNYVFMYLPAGIPRWHFDLILKSGYGANASSLIASPQVSNQFDPNTRMPIYTTITSPDGMPSGKRYEMPAAWGYSMPTTSGGTAPMTNLLSNFLSIRGINMLTDNHGFDAMKQIQPVAGGPSIDGIVAQASNRTIPAVGDNSLAPGQCYNSPVGIGQQTFNTSGNPLQGIFGAFDSTNDQNRYGGLSANYMSRRAAMEQAINSGLSTLASFANSSSPGASSLFAARSNAEKLLTTGIGDALTAFAPLQTKYQNLINLCVNANRPGVNDKAVSSALFSGNKQWLNPGDGNSYTPSAYNVSSIVNAQSSSLGNLASAFAVAEYMIGQGYSSAAVCGSNPGAWGGGFDFSAYGLGMIGWAPDEHSGGVVPSVVINGFFYHAFASCLNELISAYKNLGIWKNTVIHVASEFGRSPTNDGSGSNHGIVSNNVTIFSGAINGPLVLGNIVVDSAAAGYTGAAGTWGVGAETSLEGGTSLVIGNVATTVCSLLGVNSPTPNNASVVAVGTSGSGVIPLIGADNV